MKAIFQNDDYPATACALVCLVSAICLVLSVASVTFDLSWIPLAGPWFAKLEFATRQIVWLALFGVMYATYLFPLCGLAVGYFAPESSPNEMAGIIWLSALMTLANYFIHMHHRPGGFPDALDEPFYLLGSMFAHYGFLVACVIAGLMIYKGVECARDAGWIE